MDEYLYKHFISNTTLGLWRYDLKSGECYFPQGWKRCLGYGEDELEDTLDAWLRLVHHDDTGKLKKAFEDYVQKKTERFEVEYRLRKKDGSWAWMLAYGTGIWDGEDKPSSMLVTHIDATEKINAARNNRDNEEFRTLFNNAHDAIVLIEIEPQSSEARFVEVNDVVLQKYGYTRAEAMELGPFGMVEASELPALARNIRVLLDKKEITFETVHVKKDGGLVPVEISNHLFELEGRCLVLSIARDMTERKEAEAKLKSVITQNEELVREVMKNDKIRTEFFSNISHEFRTPLNIILGVTQLFELNRNQITAYVQTENFGKNVRIMKQNCYRLLRLVNNLLEINRLDADFVELKLENHNIVSLIEEITLSVAGYINDKGLKLVFDTDTEEKIMACDAGKIERIMLNLLSNSVKYSNNDTEIYITIYDLDEHVLISVKDTGIGIPEGKIGTIFDRFTQADSSLTRKCEGSGIGLSIVKSYVDLHCGEIEVRSRQDEGTEFLIKLPVKLLTSHVQEKLHQETSTLVERIHVEFSDIYLL